VQVCRGRNSVYVRNATADKEWSMRDKCNIQLRIVMCLILLSYASTNMPTSHMEYLWLDSYILECQFHPY